MFTGASAIAHSLTKNTTLQVLNLRLNKIGDEGGQAICRWGGGLYAGGVWFICRWRVYMRVRFEVFMKVELGYMQMWWGIYADNVVCRKTVNYTTKYRSLY